MNFPVKRSGLLTAYFLSSFTVFSADKPEGEVVELPPFSVRGDLGPFLETPLVASQSFITASEIEGINAVNVEDTIKYLPNLNVRKRYIGDTNGVTSIRGQHSWMTGRSIVKVDGVLLSNFLQTRWAGSPRWGAVSPDEIQYSEVEYGPFSAFNSGNSLGGTINLVTRMPPEREGVLKATAFSQDFSLYGSSGHYEGYEVFGSWDERVGKLNLYGFFNHLENDSQPQSYAETTNLGAASGNEPEAFGAFLDIDPRGRERIVYNSTGPDEMKHDQFKLKARYDVSENVQSQFSVVYWKSDSRQTKRDNYIFDAAGNPIWSGDYRFEGRSFAVNPAEFSVNRRSREDVLMGLTTGGKFGDGWEFDSTVSYFDVLKDEERASNRNPLDPAYDGTGRVTWYDDTNWVTFDVHAGTNQLGGDRNLSLFSGYQFSDYSLKLFQSNSLDWEDGSRDSVSNNTGGNSRMHAVFLQGGIQMQENWRFIVGARQEWWSADGGYVEDSTGVAYHPDRSESEFSPKMALEYRPNEEWKATLNLAKAYRFPLVPELFQGRVGADGRVDQNNPNLKPEDATVAELSLVHYTNGGQLRLTYFRDDVEDAIFNLLDSDLRYSLFLNIGKVETQGAEFVYDQRSFLLDRLDLRFNASYTDSVIAENPANPAYEGNTFPRIPEWRLNCFATYYFTDSLSGSFGGRYQSHSFNRLENDDFGSNYGSVSEFLVFDARLTWRFKENASVAVGVDNLFDEEYFVAHPYPQRTVFLDAAFRF